MTVVTIARPLATNAEAIAVAVGSRLGMAVYDDRLIGMAALRGQVPADEMATLDERGRGILTRPTDLWQLVPMPPIDPDVPDILTDAYAPTGPVRARGVGLDAPRFWAVEAYATLMARTISDIASGDDAVIVGRAGHVVTGGGASVLRVLCIAPETTRVGRVANGQGVAEYEARNRVRQSDRDRSGFHRQFFSAQWLDPASYDLVINTGSMSVAQSVDTIVAAASRLVGRPSPTLSVANH
jgi:hypothetical protein